MIDEIGREVHNFNGSFYKEVSDMFDPKVTFEREFNSQILDIDSESACGFSIDVNNEETIIRYWELDDGCKSVKQSFSITEGYDLKVFEEAIRMRKSMRKYEEVNDGTNR